MSDNPSLGQRIVAANKEALERIINSDPILIDIRPAREQIPEMKENWVLHAGPPIAWKDMPGSTRGAVIGALLYEQLAKTPEEAKKLAGSGQIEFHPNHNMGGVGGMTGIITIK